MNQPQRDEALSGLVREAKAPRNGQAKGIDAKIRAFEIKYEMTSAEAREKFRRGELKDTADIAQWMVLLAGR
jgi:hypothetical protein